MTIATFEQLGLSKEIVKALKENGFETPFPIQEEAIPLILEGSDVVGQAHTGTGKTAAFSLPILQKIRRNGPIQALILVPTRELAVQVTNEINKFGKYIGIRTVAIYGGQSIGLQHNQLRRHAQIVVATPGRLIDHIKQESIDLNKVNFVVLDEADRMLDMGFIDDIKFILFYIKEENRQTCLFSATMPTPILRLAQEYMKKDAKEVRLNEQELSLDTIEQSYLIVSEKEKFRHLCNFIKNENTDKEQTIIFAATKQRTQRLAQELKDEGFRLVTIHGDLSQKERNIAMSRFRKGLDNVLVATDIAARGIDVPAVGHVINYDVPYEPLIYFHRIGRTARAGATGKAISLVVPQRIQDFERILRNTKQPIRKLNDEMGISIPIAQKGSYGRDRKFRSHRGQRYNGNRRQSGTSGSSRYNQSRSHNYEKQSHKSSSSSKHDKKFNKHTRYH
jgi:ATP-dependent RNA helicase DeaD